MTRRQWVLMALAALILASGIGKMWHSRAPYYARYVSAPLPGGARYTFLYPRQMSVTSSGAGVFLEQSSSSSFSTWRQWFKNRGSSNLASRCVINVNAIPQNVKKDERLDNHSRSDGYLFIWDKKAQGYFAIEYYGYLKDFEQESKTLRDSFQILPPNAPVPLP